MEIRRFTESDRDELGALARRAGAGAPTESLWGHAESEAAVYLDPYLDIEPESLFVAVRDGALVGYLAGCVDSAAFPSEDERIEAAIRRYRLVFRRGPAAFFARAALDASVAKLRRQPTAGDFTDPRWPSHLHINVAEEGRGTGAADGLIARFLEHATAAGSPGCHLQTLVENTRAVRFFERSGFTEHGPAPLVPGLRHRGKPVHQRTMVRAL
ncbi:GNAT family N-acetyltransferase [Nocardia amikacinitolerans]|uniref:GNAT family N-acetyltransferase n=1 Tax=Nocardia amikacinitolerans TaxID=756689 RepID=UPI0020A51DC6|nr:GNAT family N-acetyltransferase [Nocardia amikacinitolerans]